MSSAGITGSSKNTLMVSYHEARNIISVGRLCCSLFVVLAVMAGAYYSAYTAIVIKAEKEYFAQQDELYGPDVFLEVNQ